MLVIGIDSARGVETFENAAAAAAAAAPQVHRLLLLLARWRCRAALPSGHCAGARSLRVQVNFLSFPAAMEAAAEQRWLRERGLDEALQFALERLLTQFREANPAAMRCARRAAARRAGQQLPGGAEDEEEEEEAGEGEEAAEARGEEEEEEDEEESSRTGSKRRSASVSRAALRSVAESLVLFQTRHSKSLPPAAGPAPCEERAE